LGIFTTDDNAKTIIVFCDKKYHVRLNPYY
jgi:hypothetical protein